MLKLRLFCLLCLCWPALSWAESLQVVEKITIEQPPEVVWAAVSDFGNLAWFPAIVRCEAEATEPSEQSPLGQNRRLILVENGPYLVEALQSYDDANKQYQYQMLEVETLPLTGYQGQLQVLAGEYQSSQVIWQVELTPAQVEAGDILVERFRAAFASGLAELKLELEQQAMP